jgi:hypothetical protein
LAVVAIGAGFMTFTEPTDFDWLVHDSIYSERFDTLDIARDQLSANNTKTRSQDSEVYGIYFLYSDIDGGDVFDPENLQQMCQTERVVLQHPLYPKYCKLDAQSECLVPQSSPVAIFYGTNHTFDCPLLSSTELESKRQALYDSLDSPIGRLTNGFFMDKGVETRNPLASTKTRSTIQLGAPLEGFMSVNDRRPEQSKEYAKFFEALEDPLVTKFNLKAKWFLSSPYRNEAFAEGLQVEYFSRGWQQIEMARLVITDFVVTICSILFVYTYIYIHTGSFFLASISMCQIVLSMPIASFIYRGILQVTYFGTVQLLTIFLVLGIGADDVFVLVDAWKQSATADLTRYKRVDSSIDKGPAAELERARLRFAYTRTYRAVFNTSFTTSVAFVATSISPVMPISTFGIFSAIAIILNYVFVITLTPAALIIYHRTWEGRKCFPPSCGCCSTTAEDAMQWTSGEGAAPAPAVASGTAIAMGEEPVVRTLDLEVALDGDDATVLASASSPSSSSSSEKTVANLEASAAAGGFFPGVYVPLMTYRIGGGDSADVDTRKGSAKGKEGVPIFAVLSMLLFTGVFIQGIVTATRLTPPTEEEQWFPTDHMFTGIGDKMLNDFLMGDSGLYTKIDFVFGIGGIDRTGFDKYKPDINRGTPLFDKDFNLASSNAQTHLLSACNSIRKRTCSVSGCSGGLGYLNRPNTTVCFMEQFIDWHYAQADTGAAPAPTAAGLRAPIPVGGAGEITVAGFSDRLLKFRSESTPLDAEGAPMLGKTWDDSIGYIMDSNTGKLALKFVVVETVSSLKIGQAADRKKSVIDEYEALVTSFNTDAKTNAAGTGLDTCFMNGGYQFVWFATEEALVQGLFNGMAICFPVALVVLLLATKNWILSLFAIASILGIVSTVLGFCQSAMGWDLGVAESIAGIIVIGFSIDYVVHLGHMIEEAGSLCGFQTREERFSYAAIKMGSTVLAGAVTTAGSNVFMFACQLTFFSKMATLNVLCIAFSFCYSLFLFMPICLLIGPEGETGSISSLFGGKKGTKSDKPNGE